MPEPLHVEPNKPAELWMLWYPGGHFEGEKSKSNPTGEDQGFWARAIDGGPHDLYLACTSEAEAREAAAYQNERWDFGRDCYPVRVI